MSIEKRRPHPPGSPFGRCIWRRWPHSPSNYAENYRNALITLDTGRVTGLVRRVSELDPELGGTLAHHNDRFEYSPILSALENGKGNRTEVRG